MNIGERILIITGDGDEREIHGGSRREDVSWTTRRPRDCVTSAKELTPRCAAELADVQIPVQVCRSFQTRDFLSTIPSSTQTCQKLELAQQLRSFSKFFSIIYTVVGIFSIDLFA